MDSFVADILELVWVIWCYKIIMYLPFCSKIFHFMSGRLQRCLVHWVVDKTKRITVVMMNGETVKSMYLLCALMATEPFHKSPPLFYPSSRVTVDNRYRTACQIRDAQHSTLFSIINQHLRTSGNLNSGVDNYLALLHVWGSDLNHCQNDKYKDFLKLFLILYV